MDLVGLLLSLGARHRERIGQFFHVAKVDGVSAHRILLGIFDVTLENDFWLIEWRLLIFKQRRMPFLKRNIGQKVNSTIGLKIHGCLTHLLIITGLRIHIHLTPRIILISRWLRLAIIHIKRAISRLVIINSHH